MRELQAVRMIASEKLLIQSIKKLLIRLIQILYICLIYCLPGKDLLQFRRPKPDTAFSCAMSASGIPLNDVFRRQRFLK